MSTIRTDNLSTLEGDLTIPLREIVTQGDIEGYGTVVDSDLTTSNLDRTAGRVLKVGDHGVGGDAILVVNNLEPKPGSLTLVEATEATQEDLGVPVVDGLLVDSPAKWAIFTVGSGGNTAQLACEVSGSYSYPWYVRAASTNWSPLLTPELQLPLGTTVAECVETLNVAGLDSPQFTGEPEAPTPPITDNSERIATTAFVKDNQFGPQVIIAAHTVAAGVDGGTLTADTWTPRPLTILTNNIEGSSNTTSAISLPAGIYKVSGWGVSYGSSASKACILRVDQGTFQTRLHGASIVPGSSSQGVSHIGPYIVTVAAGGVQFILQHIRNSTLASEGLGKAINQGPETYGMMIIEKVGVVDGS